MGLALAGSGVGQVTVPHVVRLLLDNYGFRATVLAMSLFSLIGVSLSEISSFLVFLQNIYYSSLVLHC